MLKGKDYLQFLKEGKCQEARDALEKACEEKDAYALFLKAQCIRCQALKYTYDATEVRELEDASTELGCPWPDILRRYPPAILEGEILDHENDPFYGFFMYAHVHNRHNQKVKHLRHSAELGYPEAQHVLSYKCKEPESTLWLEKAKKLHSLYAFYTLARKSFGEGKYCQAARLTIEANDVNNIYHRLGPMKNYGNRRERVNEYYLYGKFMCLNERPLLLSCASSKTAMDLYRGCQDILYKSLIAWFIVCKRFFVSRDIRILIAKMVMESREDAYLYGYRVDENDEFYFKIPKSNKKNKSC